MRVALLVVALLAFASCASAQRFIQQSYFDEFGATDSKFLCVGNVTYTNVTVGECKFGSAKYCDGSYVYSFTYTQSDNTYDPLCMSGNLTSVSRYPVGCASSGNGQVSMTCSNSTQGPDVPSIPSSFSAFTRTANFNFTNTPDSNPKVKTGYTSDCSNSAYYQEVSAKVADTCVQLTGNKKGYSTQYALTCDANYNYQKTYATTTCSGTVVSIKATPYKTSDAKCGATGISTPAVGPCASPSTPATPSYTNLDGNVYAVQTQYADDSCTAVNTTQVNWVSNLCQDTNKYICTNTTQYPQLVNMQYNDGVLCSGSFFQNVTLDVNTCKLNGGAGSGSYKLQCLAASGGSQGGSASSISVSFVTLMIAAFVAMVARQ